MPTPALPMPLRSVSTAVPAMTTPPHSAATATHRDISAPPWAAPASPMGVVQRRSATKASAMELHRPRWVLPVWRGVTAAPPSVPKVSPTVTTARQWARMRLRPIPARLRWAPTQMHLVRVPFRSAANPGRPAMKASHWVGKPAHSVRRASAWAAVRWHLPTTVSRWVQVRSPIAPTRCRWVQPAPSGRLPMLLRARRAPMR